MMNSEKLFRLGTEEEVGAYADGVPARPSQASDRRAGADGNPEEAELALVA